MSKAWQLAVLASLCASGVVWASSPSAWAAEATAARTACLSASGLAGARIAAPAVRFDDRMALDALMVRGKLRSRAGAARPIAMLCLYDRRTHRAQVAEAAAGWR